MLQRMEKVKQMQVMIQSINSTILSDTETISKFRQKVEELNKILDSSPQLEFTNKTRALLFSLKHQGMHNKIKNSLLRRNCSKTHLPPSL